MAADRPSSPPTTALPHRAWLILGLILLLTHAWLVTRNLDSGFMPRHEFRQTQTAVSILYMVKDDNFSLAYPTPLFGPPWSIPMEFPLYQWSVAGLIKATDWSLPFAARIVGLACFYLTLPGLWLLGRELKLDPAARWVWVCLTLSAPIYIFYTRSILIESMALMFGVWFLAAFARMCNRPSVTVLLGVAVAGTLAALVKVTTFVPWCLGAACLGLGWAWRTWRESGWRALRQPLTYGISSAAGPFLALTWWVRFADAIKAQSPGGSQLTSEKLTATNFGTVANRLNVEAWQGVLTYLRDGLLSWWWLPLLGLLAWGALRTQRRWFWLFTAMFAGTLALFPLLYQRHDYYLYAVGILLLASAAIAVSAIAQRFQRPLLAPLVALVLVAVQFFAYFRVYADDQRLVSYGGTGLTTILRDLVPRDSIFVVAGQNWSSFFSYYSEHRTVMLLEEVARYPAARAPYLDALEGLPITGLILTGQQQDNLGLVQDMHERFGIDPEIAVSHGETDAYFNPVDRFHVISGAQKNDNFSGLVIRGTLPPPPEPEPWINDESVHPIGPAQANQIFKFVRPRPYQYRSKFGFGVVHHPGGEALGAHPDCAFWIKVAPEHRRLHYGYGIQPAAFEGEVPTDGVGFEVQFLDAQGRELLRQYHELRPEHTEADFTARRHEIEVPAGATDVVLSTTPLENYSRDWAYWTDVELK